MEDNYIKEIDQVFFVNIFKLDFLIKTKLQQKSIVDLA